MHDKRRWLPGGSESKLVALCLDRGMSGREAASYRRVSVSTVQYWIERYRAADDDDRASARGPTTGRRRRCVSRRA